MSQSANEKLIRALVEGGLRMINNMIPAPPVSSGARRGAARVAPVTEPSTQLRLPLTQPGRGAQTYSPRKSAAPGTTETIQSAQRSLPAETSATRNQRLLQQAQESGLVVTPRGTVRTGFDTPEFAEYVYDRARTPRTTRMRPTAITRSEPQAPVPDWALSQQLSISDPEVYQAVRSIAESTARERGVNADAVMEALLSPPGSPRAALIDQLSQASEVIPSTGAGVGFAGERGALVRTPGSAATEGRIEPVNVYEVIGSQLKLPEGQAARAFASRGGVNMIDINQALQNPAFAEAVAGPAAAQVAQAGQAAARGIPLAPVAGAGILGGLGIGAYMAGRQNEGVSFVDSLQAPGTTMLGTPTATPDSGENLPAVTGDPRTMPPQPVAGATNAIPGTVNPSSMHQPVAPAVQPGPPVAFAQTTPAAPPPPPGMGAPVVQQMNDTDSNYIQAVQNAAQALRADASQYGPGQAGAFYAAQQAYAKAPGRAEEIIGALRQQGAPASIGIETDAAFETWAKANPQLAYQLQLRMQRRGPNQQMPTAQGVQVGTSLGTNFENNAIGQSRAAAENATYGSQGAADLSDALKPQGYATLQAPRSAMYAGY